MPVCPLKYAFGLFATLALATPAAAQVADTTTVAAGAGTRTAIAHWQIQSTAKAPQLGTEVSTTAFSPQAWYPVSGRATVMAGLIENGLFKDVFHGDNLRAVQSPDASGAGFVIPWWYRGTFTLPAPSGMHTLLRTNGIITRADAWVNGHPIARNTTLAGAYPVHEIDITRWVRAGSNALALRVHPADPRNSLSIGWVDWNPTPPDNNMGPWRGVDIVRTGAVELRFAQVTPTLSLPGLDRAALTVSVEARNLDQAPRTATITGEVAGVPLKETIALAAGETRTITFSPATNPALTLDHPRVWWPVGMGAQPLYTLTLAATVNGQLSDQRSATFGIRSVSSHLTTDGYRQFVVNGKPLLIRGAGWAPDMFLRDDPARMEAEFRYVLNLGLNTIRSEGKLEDARFYDLADRYGILVLAGWECCDKWESAAKTGGTPWDAADEQVALASMTSEAHLLHNHPSVIGFLIGSDNAPPPALAQHYVDALHAAGWATPIIAAAANQGTAPTGPSGMKMDGPYAWIPPSYWYADKLGGAYGFDSEVGAGATIPRLEDLERMLSPQEQEALWKLPDVRQFHASAAWSPFAKLTPFDTALAKRYGAPTSLADYAAKAQLDNYDATRAQFEAFNAHMDAAKPATGVIYWMLNNAWPSLHWHLYDYAMNPAGAYFGAKKANEPVHIQYSYDNGDIVVVNHTATDQHDLHALIRVRNLDGSMRAEQRVDPIDITGNHARRVAGVPAATGLSPVHFVELDLYRGDDHTVSRNVYWLSTKPDVLDWAKSNWYLTPLTQYADFTALQTLPVTAANASATLARDGGDAVVTVTLSVPASAHGVALFQHLAVRQGAKGALALPITWSDNDVTLWPGESTTVTGRFNAATGATPVVEIDGWRVPAHRIPVVPVSASVAP